MPTSATRRLPLLKAGLLSSARLFTRYISHTTNFTTTSKIIYPPNMANAIFAPATQGFLHFYPLALYPAPTHHPPFTQPQPAALCPHGNCRSSAPRNHLPAHSPPVAPPLHHNHLPPSSPRLAINFAFSLSPPPLATGTKKYKKHKKILAFVKNVFYKAP